MKLTIVQDLNDLVLQLKDSEFTIPNNPMYIEMSSFEALKNRYQKKLSNLHKKIEFFKQALQEVRQGYEEAQDTIADLTSQLKKSLEISAKELAQKELRIQHLERELERVRRMDA